MIPCESSVGGEQCREIRMMTGEETTELIAQNVVLRRVWFKLIVSNEMRSFFFSTARSRNYCITSIPTLVRENVY